MNAIGTHFQGVDEPVAKVLSLARSIQISQRIASIDWMRGLAWS
jgi:hypothetical protein